MTAPQLNAFLGALWSPALTGQPLSGPVFSSCRASGQLASTEAPSLTREQPRLPATHPHNEPHPPPQPAQTQPHPAAALPPPAQAVPVRGLTHSEQVEGSHNLPWELDKAWDLAFEVLLTWIWPMRPLLPGSDVTSHTVLASQLDSHHFSCTSQLSRPFA